MLCCDYRMRFMLFVITIGFFAVDANFNCRTKVISVGCFKDKRNDRALPIELLNERDESNPAWDGIIIKWTNKNYMKQFVCRCAMKAESLGYRYFGIQYFAECWSGENAHETYYKHGKSSKCIRMGISQSACSTEAGKSNTNYVYRIHSDPECETDFTPIGCFKDSQKKPRPVPDYTMTERDKSYKKWDGYLIQWEDWKKYLPELICRCAKRAKKLNHDIFSIQYFGECWSGKKIDSDYDRDGKSYSCVGTDFKSCSCYGHYCAGVAKLNYVYEVSYINDEYVKSDTPYKSLLRRRQSYYDYYGYPRYQNDGYRRKYLKRYRE